MVKWIWKCWIKVGNGVGKEVWMSGGGKVGKKMIVMIRVGG